MKYLDLSIFANIERMIRKLVINNFPYFTDFICTKIGHIINKYFGLKPLTPINNNNYNLFCLD